MHTFEIRFARSQGLAGLFEAPANRLGWKGSGRLSVDPHGISIAVKRGFLTLFSRRSRRFPAESLAEAYREGDSLRLVFGTRDRREVLAVWTRGGAAAEIVKLLPTLRTVEIEHSTDGAQRYRIDWRSTFLLVVLATLLAAGTALLFRRLGIELIPVADSDSDAASGVGTLPGTSSHRDERAAIAQRAPNPSTPGSWQSPGRASAASSPVAVPGQRDAQGAGAASPAVEARSAETGSSAAGAYSPLRDFYSEVAVLRRDYQDLRGATSASVLKELEDRWWQMTVDIYTQYPPNVEYYPTEGRVLSISRAWRNHLWIYAESLRTGDSSLMTFAQAELEFAEALTRDLQPPSLP